VKAIIGDQRNFHFLLAAARFDYFILI